MKKLLLTTLSLFALLISGSMMAATYIVNDPGTGNVWTDANGNVLTGGPTGDIALGDSVIVNAPVIWAAGSSNFGFFTNFGVIVINANATLSATNITNEGVILLYGTIDVLGTLINNGAVNGTGTVSSAIGGNIPGIFNNGTVNGNTGNVTSGVPLSTVISNTTYIYYNGTFDLDTLTGLDCADTVVFGANYNESFNLQFGYMIVEPTFTVTIANGGSLDVCGLNTANQDSGIINDGTIIIEAGGALVQTGSNTNSGSGTYQVKQTSPNSTLGYNIWSSPIASANMVDPNTGGIGNEVFLGASPCDIYVVDGSTQTWAYDFDILGTYTCGVNAAVNFNTYETQDGTADGIMDIGRGYFVPDSIAQTRTFNGQVNNGNQSIDIYANNLPIPTGWQIADLNLVGNPYPSGLNLTSFWTGNNANLIDGIYFWDHSTTGYAIWNSTGGTQPINNVAVGQGFWVIGDDAAITTSAALSFTNTMRSTTPDAFYKKETQSANHNVWVSIETPNGDKGHILVGYNNDATNGIDNHYDAHFLPANPNIEFTSIIEDENFVIQSFNNVSLGETKVIPLSVFTATTGSHTFAEYQDRQNIPSNMNIYLRDKFTRTLVDLTKGEYVVSLEGNKTYSNRFELVFENVLSKSDDEISSQDDNGVATGIEDVNNSTTFKLLSESTGYTLYNTNGINGTVQVIDMTGKVVWTKTNVNSTSVSIELDQVSSGIYFIHVMNNNQRVYSNKIVNP